MRMTKTMTDEYGIDRVRSRPICFHLSATGLALALALSLSCVEGGDFAATGGMSGTGISQGSINAFGSIFVHGVEWELGGASIEIDGAKFRSREHGNHNLRCGRCDGGRSGRSHSNYADMGAVPRRLAHRGRSRQPDRRMTAFGRKQSLVQHVICGARAALAK